MLRLAATRLVMFGAAQLASPVTRLLTRVPVDVSDVRVLYKARSCCGRQGRTLAKSFRLHAGISGFSHRPHCASFIQCPLSVPQHPCGRWEPCRLAGSAATQVSDKYPLTISVLGGYGTASLVGDGTRLKASVRNVAGSVALGDTPVLAFACERPAVQVELQRYAETKGPMPDMLYGLCSPPTDMAQGMHT